VGKALVQKANKSGRRVCGDCQEEKWRTGGHKNQQRNLIILGLGKVYELNGSLRRRTEGHSKDFTYKKQSTVTSSRGRVER